MYQFPRIIFIILTIIMIWWKQVDSGKSLRLVDCQKYVFHPYCRGTQAKKRIIEKVDSNKNIDKVCMCKSNFGNNNYGNRHGRNFFFINSKLLEAMIFHGFDIKTIYDAYSTYLSSFASVKNKNDASNEISVSSTATTTSSYNSRSSRSSISSSSSKSNSDYHRDNEIKNEERIRLPLSKNIIYFMNSDMSLMDYSSL